MHVRRGFVTNNRRVSHPVLSDTFSEGKLKDLQGSFPSDQPAELDDHGFLDDNDLEDIDDDAELTTKAETTPEASRTPLEGSAFPFTFLSKLEPQLKNTGVVPPIHSTRSVDTGTHLGKGRVVVLRDVPFVT